MHCIIAGSRSITDYITVQNAILESGFSITEVISGHAKGVDQLGEQWAENYCVPYHVMIPDWRRLGRSAGIQRNADMARYAIARAIETGLGAGLVLIWDGQSRGSASMWATAHYHKLVCFQKIITDQEKS